MGIFICPSSKISWGFEALLHELITINHIARQWIQVRRHSADLTTHPHLVTHLPSPGSDICCLWCTHTLFDQRFLPLPNTCEVCQNILCARMWWENTGKEVRRFRRQKKLQINKVQLILGTVMVQKRFTNSLRIIVWNLTSFKELLNKTTKPFLPPFYMSISAQLCHT